MPGGASLPRPLDRGLRRAATLPCQRSNSTHTACEQQRRHGRSAGTPRRWSISQCPRPAGHYSVNRTF
ncbi:hypothetical protein CALCODRAFT_493935 [Calocera cornea HHB12733]|uniref:Uncharacterized protein n=1 Tax=Calocera cornea HHB12733 TaxID=1353952 RepID=A0A165HDB9_9BASI|nr:hypothetical protein CALCODRAFT_493935 [Calocera cornea HHB12733]